MLNQSVVMGRITKDIEIRYAQGSGMAVGRFTIACERDYCKQGEERQSDFIPCIAFDKTAEHISKYFPKGSMICVVGRIQTGSYTNRDGQKVYTTDLNVEKVSFTGEKRSDSGQSQNRPPQQTGRQAPHTDNDGFMSVPDGIDEELPFN